ncbi:Triosephosphate isomerase [Sinobacterium norvegicum]|uniref:Triosephosphate isomerase n=2 Tax=Sinobacterium norvegicum TaxID=1641715 RepID=A0ABM9AG95_9GAMM|nr:Triosephosphate isomerase [Sinobacterium norvegicum]
MNGSDESIRELVSGLVAEAADSVQATVAVCPPFIYLTTVAKLLADSAIELGAQNCSAESSGAYTGEVSVEMLADVGSRYVLVGHSERRALFGETDQDVGSKFLAVKAADLTPVLCVGEDLAQREAGDALSVIESQLNAVAGMSDANVFDSAVIAYEPVWAIGTGKTASPEQAQEVHQFIRAFVEKTNAQVAAKVQILYGGSVKASNAEELFSQRDIDGALVGGAALNAVEFATICKATS